MLLCTVIERYKKITPQSTIVGAPGYPVTFGCPRERIGEFCTPLRGGVLGITVGEEVRGDWLQVAFVGNVELGSCSVC